uniref:NTR domain-containing protein n=1 Tax=Leptobrachium leishanense TaxID=445787 RepID=A0A8C5LWX8_9ANUR
MGPSVAEVQTELGSCRQGQDRGERCRDSDIATKGGCLGKQRQYKMCHIGTCPEDAIPFRSMQCALYNFKSMLGSQQGYQWVPFYGAPSVCDLTCLAVGHHFYYNFGRVLDGTRCGPHSVGTCINGRCLNEGCDGILGSDVTTDSCGTCGGRNESCIFIQRIFYDPFPSAGFFGYKNVIRIPAGATQMKVTDWSRNLLALMRSNGHYVINGNWAVSWPGVYQVAGAVFHYNRTESNHEVLEAIGPTTEDLYIMVLFQEYNPGIEYEFWVPKETTYSNPRSLDDQSVMNQKDMAPDPLVQTAPNSQMKIRKEHGELRETTTTPRTGVCRRCTKPRGRSSRIKNYCQSDFVIRAKILSRRLMGQETRYEIQLKYVYKNKFPMVHREYIWVSNICDCPELKEQKEYVLMATRHVNYEQTLNRILLSVNSYVKPWSPYEDQQLWSTNRHCVFLP